MNVYKCPVCGNTDPIFIGTKNNHLYCRKCISFRGKEADEVILEPKNADFTLNYRLSKEQKELANNWLTIIRTVLIVL